MNEIRQRIKHLYQLFRHGAATAEQIEELKDLCSCEYRISSEHEQQYWGYAPGQQRSADIPEEHERNARNAIDKYTQRLNGHLFTDEEMEIQDDRARICPNRWSGEIAKISILKNPAIMPLNTSIYQQAEVVS